MKKLIAIAAILSGVASLAIAPHARGQAYPVKSVRVIVPWPPGASNDIMGRTVSQYLSENLGQQFVVDNRAGAASIIGTEIVAKSPPDGYTLLVTSATIVANALVYKKLPYDPLRDFAGITALAKQVGILVTHPSLPVKNVKDLIALARSRPKEIVFASTGIGSFTYFCMALFNEMTKTQTLHVAYKGGGPALIALMSGETHVFITGISAALPQMKANRLRALAITAAERSEQTPDIPTLSEAGVPGYELTAWVGAFAPAATPKPIVEKLNAEMKKILEQPDVQKNLVAQTLDPMYMSVEEFAARMKSDYAKYDRLVKVTGAKVE
jgi:tripartite-type tricarboxylate transporter receptor subunit TctC